MPQGGRVRARTARRPVEDESSGPWVCWVAWPRGVVLDWLHTMDVDDKDWTRPPSSDASDWPPARPQATQSYRPAWRAWGYFGGSPWHIGTSRGRWWRFLDHTGAGVGPARIMCASRFSLVLELQDAGRKQWPRGTAPAEGGTGSMEERPADGAATAPKPQCRRRRARALGQDNRQRTGPTTISQRSRAVCQWQIAARGRAICASTTICRAVERERHWGSP